MKLEPGDLHDLQPVLKQFALAILQELRSAGQALPSDRLAYSEAEASRLLGLRQSVLRDARLRGEVQGRRIGRSVFYERQMLVNWLTSTGD